MKAILIFSFFFASINIYGQSVIFLHHSTGAGVYNEGKVASWISNYNANHTKNYKITERSYPDTPYPWSNYPYDYWNLWVNGTCDSNNPKIECLNTICNNYNVIIFKHCFPGADIVADDAVSSASSSKKTFGNYKLQYRALRNLIDSYPQNKFIVWTLVPEHRLATNDANAARAKQFVDWVKNEWLNEDGKNHPNIFVFDFYGLTAESEPLPANGKINCLKYDYEKSHTGSDSHPNKIANEFIGPKFAEFIVNVIETKINYQVTQITVSGHGGATSISTDKGSLQMEASIIPDYASNKGVNWSISSGAEFATISASGLLTAQKNGMVTIKAQANDGSGIFGTKEITITNQITKVSSITVTGFNSATNISIEKGTLQLQAAVLPVDATDKTVTWSISAGESLATISPNGLLSALKNGNVTVKALAGDGTGIYGTLVITLTNQGPKVASVKIKSVSGDSIINTDNGTLQLMADILPVDAFNKAITWSISIGDTLASISTDGLLTAIKNGKVVVKAKANDGSGIYGIKNIYITNQGARVTSIIVKGTDNNSSITANKGTLQMLVEVSPEIAINKDVTWSILSGGSFASISTNGLLTAIQNGTVIVKALAKDSSGVFGTKEISITGQNFINVSAISISGKNNNNTISEKGGTLQLEVTISPLDASDKTVSWSIVSGNTFGNLSNSGLVTALKDGTLKAKATANDGSNVSGEMDVLITGQSTSNFAFENKELKFWPNPTTSTLYFAVTEKPSKVQIFTLTGIKVWEDNIEEGYYDISNIERGCYIIILNGNIALKDKLIIY